MLDQSFSVDNFRKILDIENRKGVYLEGKFYSDIANINSKIKLANEEIRALKKRGLTREEFLSEREKINEVKNDLKEKKEIKVMANLRRVSNNVTSSKFRIELTVDNTITKKPVYKTKYVLENILTLKQLQYNFRKLYKVKQSNRYSIISQLKNLLDDGFPKIILKTDIKDFYESIPHQNLMKKINDDNLLTHLSMKFIRQILTGYSKMPGVRKGVGVPRGIGISPYLTELYMRDVDKKIRTLPNLIYYARYVDDIILIFTPQVDNAKRDYATEVEKILCEDSLAIHKNNEKTKLIDLLNKGNDLKYSFEYLGYRFSSGYDSGKHVPLTLGISVNKRKRYALRLKTAFTLYQKQARGNEKKARKLFVKRLRFLMTNTRLVNNKRNVITGIYYSNNLITTTEDFEILDRFLSLLLRSYSIPISLTKRINSTYSFVAGFDPSKISKFNALELNSIMNHWKK